MSKRLLFSGALSAAFSLLLLSPSIVLADSTLTANTTVANVAQVKATRTITVTGVPANAVTLTIGLCVVTFNTAATQDVNCNDNVAAVNTTTDATAAAVAARLQSLTNVSDTGHGALTVGGASTAVTFTTTGTETSATAVTSVLSSGATITLTTVNTTGVIPVAQTATYTFSNISAPYNYTITINGTDYTALFLGGLLQNAVTGLNSQLAADNAVSCTASAALITCVAKTAGTAFTTSSSATRRVDVVPARPQTSVRTRAAAAASLRGLIPGAVVPAEQSIPTSVQVTPSAASSKAASTPASTPTLAPAPKVVAPPAPAPVKAPSKSKSRSGAAAVENDAAAVQAVPPLVAAPVSSVAAPVQSVAAPVAAAPAKASWWSRLKNFFH